MYDIFQGQEHCESPRIVLVEGAPGSGKTVLCQKLATDWSKGQTGESFPNFRIVLNLKCRDIFHTSGELDAKALKASIVDQLLPPDAPEELKEALFEYITTEHCEALLILDGLDECKGTVKFDDLKRQLRAWYCKFLFTSRNEPKLRRSFDSLYQIVGFKEEDAKSFINKFFGEDRKEMAASLIDRIQNDAHLRDLLSNPLTTSLLCFVYNETDGELPPSKAKLYQELTRCVLLRKYEKDPQEIPRDVLETHGEDLAALGRLALKGIDKDQLHFEEHEFNAEGRATNDVLNFGFVIREKSTSKRINSPSCFQFIHKTVQEHFAAHALCTELLSADCVEGCLRRLGRKTEEELRGQYKQVLSFVVGLLSEEGERGKRACCTLLSALASREADDKHGGFVCDLVHECVSAKEDFSEPLIEAVTDSWMMDELDLCDREMCEDDVRFRVACSVLKADRPLFRLNLRKNKLRDLAALADALCRNSKLEQLWLCHNYRGLTQDTVAAVAAALTRHPSLVSLVLDYNFNENEAITELGRMNTLLDIDFW